MPKYLENDWHKKILQSYQVTNAKYRLLTSYSIKKEIIRIGFVNTYPCFLSGCICSYSQPYSKPPLQTSYNSNLGVENGYFVFTCIQSYCSTDIIAARLFALQKSRTNPLYSSFSLALDYGWDSVNCWTCCSKGSAGWTSQIQSALTASWTKSSWGRSPGYQRYLSMGKRSFPAFRSNHFLAYSLYDSQSAYNIHSGYCVPVSGIFALGEQACRTVWG